MCVNDAEKRFQNSFEQSAANIKFCFEQNNALNEIMWKSTCDGAYLSGSDANLSKLYLAVSFVASQQNG